MEKVKNNDENDVPIKRTKNIEQERDTSGDTKVFQIIKKEDIEKEKRKQAIIKENVKENNKVNLKENIKENIKEKSKEKTDENNTKKNPQKKLLVSLLIIIFILLFLVIGSTIFGLINMNSNKIIKGIKVNNIDISSLTKEVAIENLENELNNSEKNIITIKHKEYSTQINISEINGKFDVKTAVNNAYNIGRDNNIVQNNCKTIESMIKGYNIELKCDYNEELFNKKNDEISINLPDLATDSTYVIEDNKLIIKNSKDGIKIDKEKFKQQLISCFESQQKEFELPVVTAERNIIDIDQIHKEIFKEPVNAYYTTEPYKIYKEEQGLDFAISIEEAKKIVSEDKPEYEIELKTLQPQITIKDLDSNAFPDVLGTFTTNYGTADVSRNTNIAIAARSINSAIVMPGEVFSYNDLIGECSEKTGYKTSTIYLNGELSTGIGGGICQVSTTLYNAVLRANLEIVQRRNHSLGVTYVPAGQDAMVNIGTSDFKFKNNRDYPVKVVAFVGPGSITCQIQGLKQPTEYEVKLESNIIEKTDTKYKVQTFKILCLNGEVVSRTWLSTDTYKYH